MADVVADNVHCDGLYGGAVWAQGNSPDASWSTAPMRVAAGDAEPGPPRIALYRQDRIAFQMACLPDSWAVLDTEGKSVLEVRPGGLWVKSLGGTITVDANGALKLKKDA